MNDLIIKELSEKLGVAADKIWQTLIYQAHIESIYNWLGVVIFAGLASYSAKWFHCRYRNESNVSEKKGWILIGMFASLTLLCLSIGNLVTAINETFNPEYWALKQLVK